VQPLAARARPPSVCIVATKASAIVVTGIWFNNFVLGVFSENFIERCRALERRQTDSANSARTGISFETISDKIFEIFGLSPRMTLNFNHEHQMPRAVVLHMQGLPKDLDSARLGFFAVRQWKVDHGFRCRSPIRWRTQWVVSVEFGHAR
jgi:hypothetical protein